MLRRFREVLFFVVFGSVVLSASFCFNQNCRPGRASFSKDLFQWAAEQVAYFAVDILFGAQYLVLGKDRRELAIGLFDLSSHVGKV